MTVNTVSNKITYAADGATTQWSFPFPGVATSDIQVFVTDAAGNAVQLPISVYTIVLNSPIDPNPTSIGGVVTFPTVGPPLPLGNLLTIIRVLDPVQSVSLTNQSIMYPPVIEEEFDYLTLLHQQGTEEFSRAFRVGPSDPIPVVVPPVAARANQGAFFDALGNLVPGQVPGGTVFISAAMQPVVGAATLPLARELMGVSPLPVTVTTTLVVTDADDRVVLNLTGGFYTVTVGDPAGFAGNFSTFLYNSSTRGKAVSIFGKSTFILWPSQFIWIFNTDTGWDTTNPGRWHSTGAVNIYVNYSLGSDANDGLANGNQAFKTIQHAVDVVQAQLDGGITINLDDGIHQTGAGVLCDLPVLGAEGYTIIGNVANPNNVDVRGDDGSTIFKVTDNVVLTLKSMLIRVNSGICHGIWSELGAVVTVDGVNFGNIGFAGLGLPGNYHMRAYANGTIFIKSPYHILVGAIATGHIFVLNNSTVVYTPTTCTLDGPVTIHYFIVCWFLGCLHSNQVPQGFVNPGSNTGQQYEISYNSVASLAGPTPPGSIVGTASAGGMWV